MSRIWFLFLLVLTGGLGTWSLTPSTLRAEPGKSASNSSATTKASEIKVEGELTGEQELSALSFAREHHAELADLLTGLKASGQPGYVDAIRELSRQHDRLARMEARSPERYAGELELWKIDSRIRLLAAQLSMGDSASLRESLQGQLRRKHELRVEMARQERARLLTRVERLDDTIASTTANIDQAVHDEVERLLKSTRSRSPKKSPASSSVSNDSPSLPPSAPVETASPETAPAASTNIPSKKLP